VAVWRCLRGEFSAEDAARTTPVVDDCRLVKALTQLFGNYAAHDIGATTGGVWEDQSDRPRGIGLRRASNRRQNTRPRSNDDCDCVDAIDLEALSALGLSLGPTPDAWARLATSTSGNFP
jgi:hypothetical protein